MVVPTSSIGVFLPMLHKFILQFIFKFSKCLIGDLIVLFWICASGLVEVITMHMQYACCNFSLRFWMQYTIVDWI